MKITSRHVVAIGAIIALTGWTSEGQIRPKQPPIPFPGFPVPYGPPAYVSKHKLTLAKHDRIVVMGDTFAERAALFGYFETHLQARFPELQLKFRNLGFSGDTPASLLADLKGTMEYNHGSNRPLNFGTMKEHLTRVKADVIFLCVGMNDSFRGEPGLEEFQKSLDALLRVYRLERFNGKDFPRMVVVSPIAHENLGGEFPDPKEHNKHLEKYVLAMRTTAEAHKVPFVDLFTPTRALMAETATTTTRVTINGIHLNELGYWTAAHFLMDQLDLSLPRWTVSLTPCNTALLTEKTLPAPPPPHGVKVPSRLLRYLPYVTTAATLDPKSDYALAISNEICVRGTGRDFATAPFVSDSPMQNATEKLRHAIVEQNQEWFHRWRAVNGEYIYGRRAAPFGIKNFPDEMAQLDKNIAAMDSRIHKLAPSTGTYFAQLMPAASSRQKKYSEVRRYAPTVTFPSVEEVYHQKQGFINGVKIDSAADPLEALKHFKVHEGYEINLFASEKDFPLHCPLAMAWDARGRLWVTTMPSYPQYLPGKRPNDKILILEDTKGTGKADKCTIFADGLYLPTGIELGNGGAYVAAQPNLLFLKDTNGDDRADVRQTLLHGFGTGDSHHAIHMFTWSPEGALHFNEGIFHRSNVETPWGLLRQRDAAIYRFQPKSHKLETYVSYHFANPWGQVFDRWGFNFIADASGGRNYNALPITGHVDFPKQHPGMNVFTSIVRPTCGCEIVSSRHFPPEAQGNFLVNNNIGFQGIKQHRMIEEGSGFTSKEVEPLLFSTDKNFRPVDIKFGPDGALYIVDWYNPLIGHMQYSIRDPGRNHFHGRIWRITAKNRPLVSAPKIAGEPTARLLDLLKEPEDRTRYRVRAELRERDRFEVKAALDAWLAKLKEGDADHEHHLLEALWVYQGLNFLEEDLLARLLHAKDYRARAAATRALRTYFPTPEAPGVNTLGLDRIYKYLEGQVNDVHPRVRLEAVVALSFYKDARSAEIALQAAEHPLDYYLDYGLKETLATLQPAWRPAFTSGKPFKVGPVGAAYLLTSVTTAELMQMARTEPIYQALLIRDGVPIKVREEALEGLARLHKSDSLTELFAAIDRLDSAGEHSPVSMGGAGMHVLHEYVSLLSHRSPRDLGEKRATLQKLAWRGRNALTRQFAYATLAGVDEGFDRLWEEASKSPAALRDLVEAVPMIPSGTLRAKIYPRLKGILNDSDRNLRHAAIHALPSVPGVEAEVFAALARRVREGKDREASLQAIRKLPKKTWPTAEMKPLAMTLLDQVGKLDVKARVEPAALDAIQLGADLAAALGDNDLQAQFSRLGVPIVRIRTLPHNMAFDVAEFTVEAGKPSVIILENDDIMPHNLLIAEPGTLAVIGQLAEKMASDPDAFKKGFIPKHKSVLFASRLLQTRETDRVHIVAPSTPGKYVFVCTFPGHWTVMNGIMNVVPKLDAVPVADRIKMLDQKKWALADLAGDLDKIDQGRNFARGKELFTMRSCNQCHKIRGDGGNLGPDLGEITKKLESGKFSKLDLLREIVEPAAVVDKKYQLVNFELVSGQTVQGIIVHEDGEVIRVARNQVEKPVDINRGSVAARVLLPKLSMMPSGLLDRLSRDDILDLLAFVANGGDAQAPAFRKRE